MNENTLRNKTLRIQVASLAASALAILSTGWMAAQFYFDHENRLGNLEAFSKEGGRYTISQATKDHELLSVRIDAIEKRTDEKFNEIQTTLTRIDGKLDLLFTPR